MSSPEDPAQNAGPDDESTVTTEIFVGHRFRHYRIEERLGGGAFGEVYLATNENLGRKEALKFMLKSAAMDPQLEKRFRREARDASALEHENVCTIYEINHTPGGQAYIAMPYYSGGTLKNLSSKRTPLDVRLKAALQITSGLAKAHSVGIVHRDIKPSNIMLTADGTVKIVDFGIAKRLNRGIDPNETELTQSGIVLGTPVYMSPEQWVGDKVDCRSDVFSLGILLYELFTGLRPFEGATRAEIGYSIMNETPVAPSRHAPDLPTAVDGIILKALEKHRSDRYPDAGALHEQLASAILNAPAAEDTERTVLVAPITDRWWRRKSGRAGILLGITAVLAMAYWNLTRPPLADNALLVHDGTKLKLLADCGTGDPGFPVRLRLDGLTDATRNRILERFRFTAVAGVRCATDATLRETGGGVTLLDSANRLMVEGVDVEETALLDSLARSLEVLRYERALLEPDGGRDSLTLTIDTDGTGGGSTLSIASNRYDYLLVFVIDSSGSLRIEFEDPESDSDHQWSWPIELAPADRATTMAFASVRPWAPFLRELGVAKESAFVPVPTLDSSSTPTAGEFVDAMSAFLHRSGEWERGFRTDAAAGPE